MTTVFLNLDIGDLIFLLIACSGLFEMLRSRLSSVYQANNLRHAKNKKIPKDPVKRVSTILPILVACVSMLLWATAAHNSISSYYFLFFMAFGLLAGRLEFLYIINGAFKTPIPHQNIIRLVLPVALGAILAHATVLHPALCVIEEYFLITWSICAILEFFVFFMAMLTSFSDYLNIPFLTIKSKT